MNYALLLMAASSLPGQNIAPTHSNAYGHPAVASQQVRYESTPANEPQGVLSGLRSRLSRAFRSSSEPRQSAPVQPAAMRSQHYQTPEPPQAAGIEPAALRSDIQVSQKNQMRVGHDENYQWVTGQLFRIHAAGGVWVIRYASVGEEDRYGGSVVLADSVDMKNFREGDLVSVNGEILDGGRAIRNLGGARYKASSIHLIERADPPTK